MKKISFVVIAYNEERTIANCMKSILNQRELKNFDYKIIVVNDGSEDETCSVIESFTKNNLRIQLIDLKENKGRGFARYEGVKKSKGDSIVFVDADITLPEYWLVKVIPYLEKFDAVGGIAIPDGDSTYVCQKFCLEPKPLPHTSGITGSNSIYKRSIFDKIILNPDLSGGEDTDFNLKMVRSGYKIKLINNLIVNHKEDINFKKSLKRMFSFGKGATHLLHVHKKIRIPDVSFFLFILLLMSAIFFSLKQNFYFIPLFFIYPLVVSYLHLFKKFKLSKVSGFIYGGLVNYFMISSYFVGRLGGYFSKE
jgi:glycosyltransferase involved in cell wall biosynthesis